MRSSSSLAPDPMRLHGDGSGCFYDRLSATPAIAHNLSFSRAARHGWASICCLHCTALHQWCLGKAAQAAMPLHDHCSTQQASLPARSAPLGSTDSLLLQVLALFGFYAGCRQGVIPPPSSDSAVPAWQQAVEVAGAQWHHRDMPSVSGCILLQIAATVCCRF